jgi:hypothetical protein
MKLEELIAQYREETHDKAEPPFCSDELLTIFANEAQNEACRRALLLTDSTTPDVCMVDYAADDQSAPVSPLIIQITRAMTNGVRLTLVHVDEMDVRFPGWQDQVARGNTTHLVHGLDTDRYHFWPRPTQDGQLRLTVRRLPLSLMVNDPDEPEIRPEAQPGLVNWMLYRAYGRQDSDIYDPKREALALARFEAEFGQKNSARNEAWARSTSIDGPAPIA